MKHKNVLRAQVEAVEEASAEVDVVGVADTEIVKPDGARDTQ